MALGSTQPLVEMSARDIPWGKGGRCIRLTTYCAVVKKSVSLNFLDPSGPAQPVMGELYLYLYPFDRSCGLMCHKCGMLTVF